MVSEQSVAPPEGSAPTEREAREVLASEVARRRKAREWSQDHLAERAGLMQPQVSAIEAGTANPTLRTLDRLAQAFGCTAAALLSGEREPRAQVSARDRYGLVHVLLDGRPLVGGLLEDQAQEIADAINCAPRTASPSPERVRLLEEFFRIMRTVDWLAYPHVSKIIASLDALAPSVEGEPTTRCPHNPSKGGPHDFNNPRQPGRCYWCDAPSGEPAREEDNRG